MRKATGNRRTLAAQQQPPPPSGLHAFNMGRDSDASFASSRPSSAGMKRPAPADHFNDKCYQQAAIRTINAFLKEKGGPVERIHSSNHSAKEITEILMFLMDKLDYPCSKLEDDLPILLRLLNSPFTVTKSMLKAPGIPHYWSMFLAVMHWLVQLVMYNDYVSEDEESVFVLYENAMSSYVLESYMNFIKNNDAAVEELDNYFMMKMDEDKDKIEKDVVVLEDAIVGLEGELEGMRGRPSEREVLVKEKAVLEEDVRKFQAIVSGVMGQIGAMEKALEMKGEELEAKVGENGKICEENKELRKMIESQMFNARDAERMKRELQAVERDAVDAENARNSWEEKSWEIDAEISKKYKKLEGLLIECNQALRRLKLGINLQYQLDVKGTSPAKVLGIDYKVELKPALESLTNEIKNNSMEKLEELITLQRQSVELANRIEGKRNRVASLEKHIVEHPQFPINLVRHVAKVEHTLTLLKKEIEDHISNSEMEKRQAVENFEADVHNLETVEKEAVNMLKTANLNLQNTIKQTNDETQKQTNQASRQRIKVQRTHIFKNYRDEGCSLSDCHKSFRNLRGLFTCSVQEPTQ